MTWAQRLKRVFNIDIETCLDCAGEVKVIACIEEPVVIRKILDHLTRGDAPSPRARTKARKPCAAWRCVRLTPSRRSRPDAVTQW